MSSSQDSGLMSSAGLVRYFDNESSNAILIDPRNVLALCLFIGFLIEVGHAIL